MADYESLIDRVRSGSGADRELDQDLMPLAGYVLEKRGRDRNAWWYPVEGNGRRYSAGTYAFEGCPRYTSSLDAVVRLVEEKLPGWCYSFHNGPKGSNAMLCRDWADDYAPVFWSSEKQDRHRHVGFQRQPPLRVNAPRALLIALLKALLALQAQEAE